MKFDTVAQFGALNIFRNTTITKMLCATRVEHFTLYHDLNYVFCIASLAPNILTQER